MCRNLFLLFTLKKQFLRKNFLFSQPSFEPPASINKNPRHLQKNLLHIIEGCKQNELRAQEELYRYCYPDMLKVCLRYTSGDLDRAGGLYNQAMFKVFSNIIQFRNEGEFLGWIRKIVVNVCIDSCRSLAKFIVSDISETAEYILPVLPEIYNKISGNEIIKLVHQLPKNTGLVFNLFVMEGYKHNEIGAMLGISPGTSKWHLNEARRILKERIETVFKKEKLANAI
jgi:RNA polymerase sigma-70 factor (ECF subfamily)